MIIFFPVLYDLIDNLITQLWKTLVSKHPENIDLSPKTPMGISWCHQFRWQNSPALAHTGALPVRQIPDHQIPREENKHLLTMKQTTY